ncbi:MAG: non-homologous end-joining DNA ligase [Actinomycetota bacterium]
MAKKAPAERKGSPSSSTYARKRRPDETPEPVATFRGDVDPTRAQPGDSFVIHQHHATRLHFDLRLEMFNGRTPVLVSWAVPKGMPRRKGKPTLAIHVEDHPFEYGTFSGSIPKGNYGAGEVRIFDAGRFEVLERKTDKLTFRLQGRRIRGVYHLVRKGTGSGKDEWLLLLSRNERPTDEPRPPPQPMMATLIAEPFDDDAWAFEPKWDGVRAISTCDETTTIISRNQRDITVAYPELHRTHEQLVALDAMVDGEIVAFDEGVPSFEKLQSRIHVRGPAEIERLRKTIPVAYVLFDLLYLDGKDLTAEPYDERRRLLEETLVATPTIQLSPMTTGEGRALFEAARAQRLEGIVAKRRSSTYEVDKRSKQWLKVKATFEADVVIAGWTEGQGHRGGRLGALVLGVRDGEGLRYVGSVGTGFTDRTRELLEGRLRELAVDDNTFDAATLKAKAELRKAHWVRPDLVAAVEFRQLTSTGKLRAPSFKGLRDDKDLADCTMEELRNAAGLA